MTEQAKKEYAAKSIAGGGADGASLLSAGAGSAPEAATATSSRSCLGGAVSGAGDDEDKTSTLKGAEGGTDEPRYTNNYYSMEPDGKRTFLRMLYSGVRPSEAARRIAAESCDISPTTVDREEEKEAAAGEKEVLRLFAYLADRRRAG